MRTLSIRRYHMKNTKRILAVLLATTMLTGLVTGCTGEKAATTESKTESVVKEDPKKEDTKKDADSKEIVFWNISTEGTDQKYTEDSVKRFNEETKSGYKVTNVPTQNDQYKQKLTVAMSSGKCPDIYVHWSGGPMNEYIESGYADPIDEQMNKDGYKDKYLDAALAQATYKDKLYAVPYNNCSTAGIFYNKDIYEANGLKVPTTLKELEANCDALVAAGKVPFALANASKWTGSMYFMYFASRMGGLEPFNAAVSGTGTFESENFKYAGEKVQEWVDKGYFPEGVNGLDEDAGQAKQLMYTEEAAMQLSGSWMTSTYKTDSEDFYKNKIAWFPFPSIEGGVEDTSIMVGTIGDNFMSFNAEGEKLNAAFECATYMNDEKANKIKIDGGKIPPEKEVVLEDPVVKQVFEATQKASAVQLWYDQYLPPAVSEVHQSTCQELFGKTITPDEANKELQAAMKAYLDGK